VKFSQFSIRNTLLIIISTLNILIMVLIGSDVLRAWDNLRQMQHLNQQSEIIDLLFATEKRLSQERGLSMAISGTASDLHDELENARNLANYRLNAALRMIDASRNSNISQLIRKIENSQQTLQLNRQNMDNALAQETDSVAIANRIFDIITTQNTDIAALIQSLSVPLLTIDPIVAQRLAFTYFIWEITEYGGRGYAQIGRLLAADQMPTPEMQNQLIAWNSRTAQSWDISLLFARSSQLEETMASHIDEARTHYAVTFEQIKDMFYETGPAQITPPYPLPIELWLDMAFQVQESVMGLKDMARQETQSYVRSLVRQASRTITVNLLLFISALLLSFYSWFVITHRVVRPVNQMVDSLYRQAHGAVPPPSSANLSDEDEIGKLRLVLNAFKENTRKIEQISDDLEQQRDNLQAIFQTALDAIIVTDQDGLITEWNQQAEVIFGWSREEAMGQIATEIIIPPHKRVETAAVRKKFLSEGDVSSLNTRLEMEALNRAGEAFPIELSVVALKTQGRYNFISFISDISERKRAEQERLYYTKSLEDSNRELDDFAYIASHDLKEPLRGLHNFSRFLLEDYEDKLDDEGKNMLHTIADLTRRMDQLLSSLLNYSRMGRTALSVRATDLNNIVRNAIAMYGVKIKEENALVKIRGKLPTIICDHVRIAEVFQNIIGNALKYNDKAEKKITIGHRNDHPDCPGEIVYFVEDNGIGIDKKNAEVIFKIFRRLHAQDAYGGGTGSGLTIARKIILQHGGNIWVESPGKGLGSTFYFTIPPQNPEMRPDGSGKREDA